MATFENKGHMTYKDKDGNKHIMYPVTQMECVEGLEEALANLEISGGGGGGFVAQPEPPEDKTLLWVDTDDETGSEGGSPVEIPVFDLTAMGLPTITLDGEEAYCECDTTELMSALRRGVVCIRANVDNNGTVFSGEALVMETMSITDDIIQTITRAELRGVMYDFQMFVTDGEITVLAIKDGATELPEYTEADYGKVLTCTADGLVWTVAGAALPNAEEAEF